MRRIGLPPCRTMGAKDVSDLQLGPGHPGAQSLPRWRSGVTRFSVIGTSCLMIEKAPIVRQVSQIAKCVPLRASHPISQKCQCRGAASSLGRQRRLPIISNPENTPARPSGGPVQFCVSASGRAHSPYLLLRYAGIGAFWGMTSLQNLSTARGEERATVSRHNLPPTAWGPPRGG